MSVFRLSAFADEAGQALSAQIEALQKNRIGLIELRNVDGKSCVELTDDEARSVRDRLSDAGIGFSALGSPCGKFPIEKPFEEHLTTFRRALEICHILGAKRMRMFSFFMPQGDIAPWRNEVIDRLAIMLDLAEEAGVELCHENEKGIYGEKDNACIDLLSHFGGRLKAVYDPANFAQAAVGAEAFPATLPYLSYLHIKDAMFADGAVVPAGKGDGGVLSILSQTAQAREETVLTLEPHLTVFDGLKGLQDEELKHRYSYPDAATAFTAASDALKELLTQLNFMESKGETGVWTR